MIQHSKSPAAPTMDTDAAQEQFFITYYPQFERVLTELLNAGPQEAEEALQEGISKIFNNWASIEHHDGWALLASVAELIGIRKREERLRSAERQNADLSQRHDEVDPQQRYEDSQAIEELLSALPPAQRKTIRLMAAGHSIPEIAEETAVQPDTVRSNVRHARDNLRRNNGRGRHRADDSTEG